MTRNGAAKRKPRGKRPYEPPTLERIVLRHDELCLAPCKAAPGHPGGCTPSVRRSRS